MRIPPTLLPKIKQEVMIPQEKDLGAMTIDEKVYSRILLFVCLFIAPFSTASSFTSAEGIVPSPSPSPDQVVPNNHLALLALPQHL
jgi:hypothetical protein